MFVLKKTIFKGREDLESFYWTKKNYKPKSKADAALREIYLEC